MLRSKVIIMTVTNGKVRRAFGAGIRAFDNLKIHSIVANGRCLKFTLMQNVRATMI